MTRLLIVYSEREYGSALAKAISGIHKGFDLMILSSNSALKDDSVLFTEQWDFLLTDYGLDSPIIERLRNHSPKTIAVILTEFLPEMISKQSGVDSGFWQIYKYTPVDEILNDLSFLSASLTDNKIVNPYIKSSLLGVLGVSGGVGTTSIAMGLSRELSRYHDKRILYLSFEELPVTELYVTFGSGCRIVSDFLYYLFERKDEAICSHLEGFTTADDFGVRFFCPSKGRNDLRSLTKDELEYFIKYLTDSCRYDYILIDFNHDISPETQLLLSYCSRLIMVHKNEPVSLQKQRKLVDYLRKSTVPTVKETLINVCNFNDINVKIDDSIKDRTRQGNFKDESEQANGNNDSLQNLIMIDADVNSFFNQGEKISIDISQTFGIGIKHIAETVLLAELN